MKSNPVSLCLLEKTFKKVLKDFQVKREHGLKSLSPGI